MKTFITFIWLMVFVPIDIYTTDILQKNIEVLKSSTSIFVDVSGQKNNRTYTDRIDFKLTVLNTSHGIITAADFFVLLKDPVSGELVVNDSYRYDFVGGLEPGKSEDITIETSITFPHDNQNNNRQKWNAIPPEVAVQVIYGAKSQALITEEDFWTNSEYGHVGLKAGWFVFLNIMFFIMVGIVLTTGVSTFVLMYLMTRNNKYTRYFLISAVGMI